MESELAELEPNESRHRPRHWRHRRTRQATFLISAILLMYFLIAYMAMPLCWENYARRNHVRLWKTDKSDPDGRPVWIGSATFDEQVGLSHTTGQITHHIAPDVDEERDLLFLDLSATGSLSEDYFVDDFHTIREGRNGGGDPWYTDGRLEVGVIAHK